MARVQCLKIFPKFLTSEGAQQRLRSPLFSLITFCLCSGMWMWITSKLDSFCIRVMGRGFSWGSEEDQMAESLFWEVQFSCVSTSAHLGSQRHLGASLTFREMNQATQHLSLVHRLPLPYKCSWLTYVIFMCNMCLSPKNTLPFLIDRGSQIVVGPFCNLEVTQRFSRVEDLEPISLNRHSLS